MSLGSFARLFWSFGGVMFPWFFTFLEVLRCCPHIWSSSYRPGVFTNCLQERNAFLQPCQLFWSFLRLSRVHLLYAFPPSCGRILKPVHSFDPAPYQAKCRCRLVCFYRNGAEAQVCGLFLALRFRLALCAMLKLALPAAIETSCRELATGWGGVGKVHRVLWVAVGLLRDLWVGHSQWLMGRLLGGIHDGVSRTRALLMPSESPVCFSPSLFPPAGHAARPSVLWMGRDRNELLLHNL